MTESDFFNYMLELHSPERPFKIVHSEQHPGWFEIWLGDVNYLTETFFPRNLFRAAAHLSGAVGVKEGWIKTGRE